MIDMMIIEGDTTMAQMVCGNCQQFFRADYTRVASVRNIPFCLKCLEDANVLRKDRGMAPLLFDKTAYSG